MTTEICTLKELTQMIHALELDVAVLKTTIKKDKDSVDLARELQAREYERRLDGLNGESDRLKHMQGTYVPRETHAIDIDSIKRDVTTLLLFKENQTGRSSVIAIVVSVAISAAFLLLNIALR